jgi:hypothetical protein
MLLAPKKVLSGVLEHLTVVNSNKKQHLGMTDQRGLRHMCDQLCELAILAWC